MIKYAELTNEQLDMVREIGNIGAGHAATALSQFLVEKIEMDVPAVSIIPLTEVSDFLGGAEKLVIGVYLRVFGDAPAKIIFVFSQSEAKMIFEKMIKNRMLGEGLESPEILKEYEISALKEIGNIMTGAYLYALTNLTGFNLLPSVPAFASDMAGAIINTALADLGVTDNHALLIITQFRFTNRDINGHFFLVPENHSLELILDAIITKHDARNH
ncbi:MAG TPA: chemotaxis protein CheC [Bacillota bacterium]|nr:chemotaxis protein CheC [Bacillota bacterium]